ncbi:MAG: YeiH family protein [Oscillospiraceae bacterium]
MVSGLVVCLLAAFVAMKLAAFQNIIGAPMIGLFIGILIANLCSEKILDKLKKGASFASKYLLKVGIIITGATLNFKVVVGVGLSALPLIIFNICLSFLVAYLVGKAMGVSSNTRTLVGGGTAICGGTAIATLTPIVKAREDEMAYAMAAIFLFDILAAIMWPYAARAMGFTAQQYGFIGGLAISDTSSVTAAGATFDTITGGMTAVINGETLTGGDMAVVVKLTRTVMLVFVAIAVMLAEMFRSGKNETEVQNGSFARRALKAFPLFVLGFLLTAVLNTVIDFGSVSLGALTLKALCAKASKYFISCALVGVGFKIKFKELFTKGAKPVLLGGCTWLAIAASTLSYVLLFL